MATRVEKLEKRLAEAKLAAERSFRLKPLKSLVRTLNRLGGEVDHRDVELLSDTLDRIERRVDEVKNPPEKATS